jgi:ATP-dependent RNA helicase DDX10/DBP4
MDGVGALVISPTRELAAQIFDVLRTAGKHHSFSAGLVIGGKAHGSGGADGAGDFAAEQARIIGINILICTPGMLCFEHHHNLFLFVVIGLPSCCFLKWIV